MVGSSEVNLERILPCCGLTHTMNASFFLDSVDFRSLDQNHIFLIETILSETYTVQQVALRYMLALKFEVGTKSKLGRELLTDS